MQWLKAQTISANDGQRRVSGRGHDSCCRKELVIQVVGPDIVFLHANNPKSMKAQ